MDQSSNQNAPSQNQQPGHRDMMFCHECADEWYRDEHGLSCPECGSDFTEIVSSAAKFSFQQLTRHEMERMCIDLR
jgi:Zn finger protein HypA/HybF involved in hydrogenase expression